MIRIQQLNIEIPNFKTELEYDKYETKQIEAKLLKLLKIAPKDLHNWTIVRRSLDARKKPLLFYSYIIDANICNEQHVIKKCKNPLKTEIL